MSKIFLDKVNVMCHNQNPQKNEELQNGLIEDIICTERTSKG